MLTKAKKGKAVSHPRYLSLMSQPRIPAIPHTPRIPVPSLRPPPPLVCSEALLRCNAVVSIAPSSPRPAAFTRGGEGIQGNWGTPGVPKES
mmetsp:Transcript_4573/g.8295  ORF Transcript_4573/g.8295 Transcript_4573/m.8295 type:complete len:91 (+) Transcript_4573:768-1040(+)